MTYQPPDGDYNNVPPHNVPPHNVPPPPPPPPPPPGNYYYNPEPPKQRAGWILPTVIASVLVLLLICALGTVFVVRTFNNNPGPIVTTSAPNTPTPVPSGSVYPQATQSYLILVKQRDYYKRFSDITLLNLGVSVCADFIHEATFNQIVKSLTDAGVSAYDAGWLIGAATRYLCPGVSDKLPKAPRPPRQK